MNAEVRRPHPSRCDPRRSDYEAIIVAHREAVLAGQPTYRDPSSGLMVLTVTSLLERNSCCESLCRHCPYLDD